MIEGENVGPMTLQACLHILELDTMVDHDQIHRAYRRQVRCWHPDQFTHKPEIRARAEERLKQINHAYATLKEYVKNHPPDQTFCDGKDQGARTDKTTLSKPSKQSNPFNWKQWFKPKNRRSDHQKANTARKGATHRCERTTLGRKRTSFDRILREAAAKSSRMTDRRYTQKGYGTYRFGHLRCIKSRKKGMRIEGHASAAPITPIKPISKISKIESSG